MTTPTRPQPRWHACSIHRRAATAIAGIAVALAGGCGPSRPSGDSPSERSKLSLITDRPGVVRVDGISEIAGFARGRDCTFMHCLEIVLEAIGRPVSYDELMGLSGMAFRTQFRIDRWDVGNSDPLVGENCVDPVFREVGMTCRVLVVRRDQLAEADAMRRDVAESIERNRTPVIAANVIPPEDWGIITGYTPGYNWLCRSYNGGATRADRPATGWPAAVVIIDRLLPRPDRMPSLSRALRRAVDLFDQRSAGNHALGAKAFDYWCQSLRTVRDRTYLHANAWTYVCLIDARQAAVRFLRSIAGEFGSRGRHLQTAAEYFEQEVAVLREGYRYVPAEKQFPDTMPPPELRDRQIQTLLRAKSLEEKAIAAIRSAL